MRRRLSLLVLVLGGCPTGLPTRSELAQQSAADAGFTVADRETPEDFDRPDAALIDRGLRPDAIINLRIDAGTGALLEECGGDHPDCGDGLVCSSGVCCAEACDGECQRCGTDGLCEAAIGRPCGAPYHCEQQVHSFTRVGGLSICRRYRSSARGSCDSNATCEPAKKSDCADVGTAPFLTCDSRCTADTAETACQPGALIAQISKEDFCETNVVTSSCAGTTCVQGGSADGVGELSCDGTGLCRVGQLTSCGGFTCERNTGMCLTQCSTVAECTRGFRCQLNACEPL